MSKFDACILAAVTVLFLAAGSGAAESEKIKTLEVAGEGKVPKGTSKMADVVSALVALGYREFQAREAAVSAMSSEHETLEDLIKSALKYLRG